MSDQKPTLDELFADGRAIDEALREAARDARRLHKAFGRPMATWKDGQVGHALALPARRRVRSRANVPHPVDLLTGAPD